MPRVKDTMTAGALRTAARTRRSADRAAVRANRRRAAPRWLGPVVRLSAATASLAVVIGIGAWSWQSGWIAQTATDLRDGMVRISGKGGLAVADVLVEGRRETDADEIMAILGVERGTPILAFDPDRARDALEALPWVATAVVERRLPDTIYVRLTERKPMALWQNDRKLHLIDAEGVVLAETDLERFADLPILVGGEAPRHVDDLMRLLSTEPGIAARVQAATWIGERRWDLRLDNGVDIRLPESGAADALRRLSEVEAAQPILDRDIVAIDLRMPDRLVVQTSAAAAARRRAPEERI